MDRRVFMGGIPAAALWLAGCSGNDGSEQSGTAAGGAGKGGPLADACRVALFDDLLPFWMEHGLMADGAVQTCLDDAGIPACEGYYVEPLAQALWTFSALCRRPEPRAEWRGAADGLYRFLTRNALLEQFTWAYRLDGSGAVKEGAISIWSAAAAAEALMEYSDLTGNQLIHKYATDTITSVLMHTAAATFDAIAPFPGNADLIHMGVTRIRLSLTELFLKHHYDNTFEGIRRKAILYLMKNHLNRRVDLLFTILRRNGDSLDTPEGRLVNPGLAIHTLDTILESAHRTGDMALVQESARLIRRHLEHGWDEARGGLAYALDSDGAPLDIPGYPAGALRSRADHADALATVFRAREITGEDWCGDWLQRLSDFTFERFHAGPGRDWHVWLDPDGAPTVPEGLPPLRDFYHVPRACLRIMSGVTDSDA